jgi:hypothetical protein
VASEIGVSKTDVQVADHAPGSSPNMTPTSALCSVRSTDRFCGSAHKLDDTTPETIEKIFGDGSKFTIS